MEAWGKREENIESEQENMEVMAINFSVEISWIYCRNKSSKKKKKRVMTSYEEA